jgi:tetratricopeptide (TPR) repeat protein
MSTIKLLSFATIAAIVGAIGMPTKGDAVPAGSSNESAMMATTAPPEALGQYIFGHAAINNSAYEQHLQAGLEALQQRHYGQAELHLQTALSELRKHNISDERALVAKLSLGQTLFGEERYENAQRYLEDCVARLNEFHNQNDQVNALCGLAEVYVHTGGDLKKAHALCDQALAIKPNSTAYTALGATLKAEGLDKLALSAYRQALKLAEADPKNKYEIGEIHYQLGIDLHNSGETEEAAEHFEKAFAIQDQEAKFQATLYSAPRLTVHWERGNPRARQIADNSYPLRYVVVGDLRVAATAVRSENVIAVIISLANCGRSRLQLAVGPVSLEQMKPKHRPLLYVSEKELDVTLEQEHVTDLTWRRRWLNHIEKTRYIPGYLKNNALDWDNFFGNNIFGEYGNWPIIGCDETPIVTREEFLYGRKPPQDPSTVRFLRDNRGGYRPTYLDPGDAKTGLVFFKQERFDAAELKINIGNTVVEIPFENSAGPR